MRVASKLLTITASLALVACGGGGSESSPEATASATDATQQDAIDILSVDPAFANAGVTTSFNVRLKYRLVTKPSGIIYIGFNGLPDMPEGFKLSTSFLQVDNGSGTVTLAASGDPVVYSYPNAFKVYVNLSEFPHAEAWTPLATDERRIAVYAANGTTSTTQELGSMGAVTCIKGQCSNAPRLSTQ